MTAQEQLTLRTVLLHNEPIDSLGLHAYRLLNDLGYDVATARSVEHAIELLQGGRADLVVVDADGFDQKHFVTRLNDLPADQQPRQIAIFSDAADETLSNLVRQLNRAKVHVLLKPLHMHGLLGVLRSIEAKASTVA